MPTPRSAARTGAQRMTASARQPLRAQPNSSRPFSFRRAGQLPTDRLGILDFGRYAGWSIADLARQDPDYLQWLSRHSSGIRYRTEIAKVLEA